MGTRATSIVLALAAALALAAGQAGLAQPAQPPEQAVAEIGRPAPDFALLDADGQPVRLSDYEGLLRLVTFIAPGIGVCDLQTQALDDLWEAYRSQGLVVLGVSTQRDPDCLRAYAGRLSFSYPLMGISPTMDAAYGHPSYLPTTFLVGRDGILLREYEGYTDSWAIAADLQAPLAAALPVAPGRRAPVFGVRDIFGRRTRLDDFRGLWVVLAFLPTLNDAALYGLAKNLAEKAFASGQGRIVVIAFVPDKAEEMAMAVEAMALPPRVVSDPWHVVFGVYRAADPDEGQPQPAVVLLDPEGVISAALYGAQALDIGALNELIEGLPSAVAPEQS
jgi:peroxiredoxin